MASRWVALSRQALPALARRLRREAARPVLVQPVLRDTRAEHFLFEGDRLTGLVDFGAMGLDSPAADLARLMSDWVGPDHAARAEALDAYAAVRSLDPVESSLIDVFAESAAWLGPARWVRWHLVEHRRFDDPDAARIGLDRALGRLIERLP
jgi:homoserine kinase type II